MTSIQRLFIALGCTSAGIGVAAGAFGAHGLKTVLTAEMLAVFETAVRYQMYHAFGLIAAGLAPSLSGDSKQNVAGWCFVAGTILFSGSLYALTLTNLRWLGVVTPFGGVAFIAGWFVLAIAVLRAR